MSTSTVSFPGWKPIASGDVSGVNFALALSRLSGLPIEFTYLYDHTREVPSNSEITPAMLCGLSVADADSNSYRPEGVYSGETMVPAFDLVAQAKLERDQNMQQLAIAGRLSLGTRIIAEQQARSLGLLPGEDTAKIVQWLEVIPANRAYYKTVPKDLSLPSVHAHLMQYAHGECHFYALALAQATEGTPMVFPGETHSLVHHGDLVLEDVWGYRDPISVSRQYGARSPDDLNADKFSEMIAHFKWKLGRSFQGQIDRARRVVDMRLEARASLQARPIPSGP